MALPWVIQQIRSLSSKFPVSIANGGTGVDTLAELKALVGGGVVGAPKPQTATGVGQWVLINGTLPAGGTWCYGINTYRHDFDPDNAYYIDTWKGFVAGVAAGGSYIVPNAGSSMALGFAWRVA